MGIAQGCLAQVRRQSPARNFLLNQVERDVGETAAAVGIWGAVALIET